jgi:hypothetical protein
MLGGVTYEARPAPDEIYGEEVHDEDRDRLWLYRPGMTTPAWKLSLDEATGFILSGGLLPKVTIPCNLSCWSEAEQDYYRSA